MSFSTTLPLEIIEWILKLATEIPLLPAYRPDALVTGRSRRQVLCACSLISRAWFQAAQPMLWTSVYFADDGRSTFWPASPVQGRYKTRLLFIDGYGLLVPNHLQVFARCAGFEELHYRGMWREGDLVGTHLSDLKSFFLYTDVYVDTGTSPLLPCPFSLTSLSLDLVHMIRHEPLRSILSSSSSTLQSLRLLQTKDIHAFTADLPADYQPPLRYLYLGEIGRCDLTPLARLCATLIWLELELRWDPRSYSDAPAGVLLTAIGPSLQFLSILIPDKVEVMELMFRQLLARVRAGELPGLKVLQLEGGWSHGRTMEEDEDRSWKESLKMLAALEKLTGRI